MAEIDGKKIKFLINCIYFATLAAIVFFSIRYLLGWIMPFIIGFILAVAVQAPVNYLHKRLNANVKACSVAGVLLLVIFLLSTAFFCIFQFACWASEAAKKLPLLIDNLMISLNRILTVLSPFITKIQQRTGLEFDSSLNGISRQLFKLSQLPEIFTMVLHSVLSSFPVIAFDTIIAVVAACFIAADFSNITMFLFRCLPSRYREMAADLKNFFLITVANLLRAYFKLMLITFAELLVGFLLLGIPNALILALAIAVVDIMPVLGTGTVMIPWVVIEFLVGKTYLGAGLACIYIIIAIVRNILEPRIVGNNIGLHPLTTLVSMVVGLKILGLAGMFIFPIVIIILKHLHHNGFIKI